MPVQTWAFATSSSFKLIVVLMHINMHYRYASVNPAETYRRMGAWTCRRSEETYRRIGVSASGGAVSPYGRSHPRQRTDDCRLDSPPKLSGRCESPNKTRQRQETTLGLLWLFLFVV